MGAAWTLADALLATLDLGSLQLGLVVGPRCAVGGAAMGAGT